MVRKPNPIDKLPFPEVWHSIKSFHKEHWGIRLRPATNLIEYYLFPVGWHWSEFVSRTDEDRMPYEAEARQLSDQGIALKRPVNKATNRMWKCGRDFRRHAATSYLEKLLVRDELKYFCSSVRNSALPNRDPRPATRNPNRADFSKMRVADSTVGRLTSEQFDLTIDACMLVELLVSVTETRGAPRKHNSLEIERWCRNQLERKNSFVKEPDNLRARLIDSACDWQGETQLEPAGQDQVRPIVDKLMAEYCAEE